MLKALFNKYKNSSLLKTGFRYSLASSSNSFVNMIVGILIIKWLEPKEIGMWNAVSIFQAYIPFFLIGIQTGLNLELPIIIGKNDNSNIEKYVSSAKWFAYVMTYVFTIFGIIVSSTSYILNKNLELSLGILTIGIIASCISLNQHLIATFRSSKSFDKLTKIILIQTLLSICSVIFIYLLKYWGILLYNILLVLSNAVLMLKYAPYNFEKKYDFYALKFLCFRGGITMAFYQMRVFAQSIPKWLILKLGSIMQLGLYTPAIALNGVMNLLPNQIGQFLHPQLGHKYGQTGQAKSMWPVIMKMLILFPLVSLPICAIIWAISPWLLQSFFPKYLESLWPMRFMALAFVFSSYYMTHGVLYTIKAYRYSFFFSIAEIIGYFLFPILSYYILDIDLLTKITIGIAINNIVMYILNIFILKKVLFIDRYNIVS